MVQPEFQGQQRWIRSRWVRRRYYVENGYIRPVVGSKVEYYDPFEEAYFDANTPQEGTSLYLELIGLDLEDPQAIERFTSRWGLLGLCQHSLLQHRRILTDENRDEVRLDPPPLYVTEICEGSDFRTEAYPVEPEYLETLVEKDLANRGIGRLDASGEYIYPDGVDQAKLRAETSAQLRRLAAQEWLKYHHCPSSSVLIETPQGSYEEVPQDEYLSRYYPGEETDAQGLGTGEWYPGPDAWNYWDKLCEPVEEFKEAVTELRATFERYESISRTGLSENPWDDGARYEKEGTTWVFLGAVCAGGVTRHIRRVHPIPVYLNDERRWSRGWSFPSLLSAVYMMLYLDLTAGRGLRICANEGCNTPFVTDRSDRKFCSDRCLNAAKQRAYRRRRAAEAQNQAQ